jgi:hypothetical protein
VVARTPVPSAPVRPSVWGAEVFDAIEWRRFEALVEALLRQGGFETRSQSQIESARRFKSICRAGRA